MFQEHITEEALGIILHERSSGFFKVVKARQILDLIKKDGNTASKFQTSRDFIIKNCIDENTTIQIVRNKYGNR